MRRPENADRPHAYAIESDSEQSDFEDIAAGPRPRTHPSHTPSNPPQLSWSADIQTNKKKNNELTILVGPAGEFWDAGISSSTSSLSSVATCHLTHQDNTVPVAALFTRNNNNSSSSSFLLALSSIVPIDSQYILAHSIISSLDASSITIIDSYAYHEYNNNGIDDNDDDDDENGYPPVRILATSSAAELASSLNTPLYQPPNLLHGISAAILSLAQHKNIKAIAILLPSPVIPQICTSISAISSAHTPGDLRDFLTPTTSSALQTYTTLLNWSSSFTWKLPSYTRSFPLPATSSPTFSFLRKWRLEYARISSAQASGMYI